MPTVTGLALSAIVPYVFLGFAIFAGSTLLTFLCASRFGYNSFGGNEKALIIRVFTWGVFVLGAIGLAVCVAFVAPHIRMGATFSLIGGIFLGLALHGPMVKPR